MGGDQKRDALEFVPSVELLGLQKLPSLNQMYQLQMKGEYKWNKMRENNNRKIDLVT